MSFSEKLQATAAVLTRVQAGNPNHATHLLHDFSQRVNASAATLDIKPSEVPPLNLGGNAIVPTDLFQPDGDVASAQRFVDDAAALYYNGSLTDTGTGGIKVASNTGYYAPGLNAQVPDNATIQPPSAFVVNMPKFALWEDNAFQFFLDPATTFVDRKHWKQFCDAVKSYGQGGVSTVPAIFAERCHLSQAAVDNLLLALDASGITGGTVAVNNGGSPQGSNAAPSASGAAAATSLRNKGWSVSTNPTV